MEPSQDRKQESLASLGAAPGVRMQGGTGAGSFHEFSMLLQSALNVFFQPKLCFAITTACEKLLGKSVDEGYAKADDLFFALADFGCASASSTITNMDFMIKCVLSLTSFLSRREDGARTRQLHIQALFNDLPSNDFNTLFSLLAGSGPLSSEVDMETGGISLKNFVPFGVPGSFYRRLFPSRYLSVAFSALALHNLSMVPEAVEDQNSPAWNENGLWNFDGCKSETALEYKRQFERDFSTFMAYRSQELLSGGLLFCVMIASNRGVEGMHSNNLYENLQKAWRELISEGLLSQESLDTFNLPLFLPTLEEVKEMVEEQKEFEVLLVEYVAVERAPANAWKKFAAADGQMWGNTIQTMTRNFMGGLLEPHLGVPKFEMLMQRVKELAAADDERFRSSLMGTIVLALIRK